MVFETCSDDVSYFEASFFHLSTRPAYPRSPDAAVPPFLIPCYYYGFSSGSFWCLVLFLPFRSLPSPFLPVSLLVSVEFIPFVSPVLSSSFAFSSFLERLIVSVLVHLGYAHLVDNDYNTSPLDLS